MPRFFVTPDQMQSETIFVLGEDARHMAKSLRMRPGEEVVLCDGAGADYRCALEAVSDGQVRCRILSRAPSETEPRIAVTLYQALPKGDKLDFIVQKAVELGAVEVVPVLTRLCVSRPDERAAEKKVQRLQKIAEEAAKQSGRGILPAVRPLLPLDRALERMGASDLSLICYEGGGEPFTSLLPRKELRTLSLLVGSEGGFDPEEVQAARERGVRPVTLGRRILRCETAPLAALTAVMLLSGEMA